MTTSPDPRKNQLLAALPEAKLQRWLQHLEYVELPMGEVLHEAGGAVIGNDGLVGVSLFMGGDSASSRALVQSAGGAYRLTAQ